MHQVEVYTRPSYTKLETYVTGHKGVTSMRQNWFLVVGKVIEPPHRAL